jgi:anti-sigma regulatory factor (Ser/Thr protein kinase)
LITLQTPWRGVRRIAETPDPTPRTVFEELLPVSGAAWRARNVVTDACLRWHLPDLVGSAALIISELVSNVVDHAQTVMTIEVAHRDSHLYLAVHDGASAPPVLRELDGDAPALRGRGLMLIAAAATTWGYDDRDDGKTVWATVAFPEVTDP